MDGEFPEWTFRFRVMTKGGGKGKVGKGGGRGEEGLRAVSRAELEGLLAAGNQARAWRAEAKMRRWEVVQERRRRQLVEEEHKGAEARAAAVEERAAKADEEAKKYFLMMGKEVVRRRAAEAEVERLRALMRAEAVAGGPIALD